MIAPMPTAHYAPDVQPWTRDELEAALDAVIDQLGDLLDRNDYRTVVALDAQADELAARLARLATTNTTGNAR